MLEWVCPECDRAVPSSSATCPFCGGKGKSAQAPSARRWSAWRLADAGFRFGLGLIASVAAVYFVLLLWAYFMRDDALFDRLTHWLRLR